MNDNSFSTKPSTTPTHVVWHHTDVLEGRKDVPLDVERRLDTLHLFGVDVMSTGDVLRYFTEFGPTYVEWINDSSCMWVGGRG